MKKIIIFLLLSVSVFAQKNINHEFPRLWEFQHGGVRPGLDVYMQWLVVHLYDSTRLRVWIPQTTRNGMYIGWGTDWNYGSIFGDATSPHYITPVEWRILNSDGSYSEVYGNSHFADHSQWCAPYTGTFSANEVGASKSYTITGETWRDALARYSAIMTPMDVFDMIFSNGTWTTWSYIANPLMDLDRNGAADAVEHGSTWQRTQWFKGQSDTRDSIRNAFARKCGDADSILFSWNTAGNDTMTLTASNGVVSEEFLFGNSQNSYTAWKTSFPRGMWDSTKNRLPRINGVMLNIAADENHATGGQPHNNFPLIRGTLTITQTMSNFYYEAIYGGHQYYAGLYDEYFTDLGHPVSQHPYQGVELANGVWVRFFQRGAMICNPTTTSRTISVNDLSGLSGYPGTLYRFNGNQDTLVNTGGIFTSVTLQGYTGSPTAKVVPAGIILKTVDTLIIAPIYVDNSTSANSPGSDITTFSGTWSNSLATGYAPWWWLGRYDAYPSGQYKGVYVLGSATETHSASYYPKINVSADYNVYEWHAWLGGSTSALIDTSTHKLTPNVPAVITHADGIDTVYINQRINPGQWNYLGRYRFQVGITPNLKLSNKTGLTSRYVLADAFKFEWVPPEYVSPAQKKVIFKKP